MLGGMEGARVEFTSDKCFAEVGRDVAKEAEVALAVRLWPHRLRGEGHFMCVLKRDGELLSGKRDGYVPGGRNLPAYSAGHKAV